MKNFSLEVPINSVSFGQIAMTNVLYPAFKNGLTPNIFPIGGVDIGCYTYLEPEFKNWLVSCIKDAHIKHNKSTPTLKLWHLNEGTKSYSDNTTLLTFHETDMLTPSEAKIINGYKRVLVTNKHTQSVFSQHADNVHVFKPAFDSNSFSKTNRKYTVDGVIMFGLAGKLENRKKHVDIIKLWAERFGNNRNYVLNCALSNQHLSQEQHGRMLNEAFNGKEYNNIIFNPFMNDNKAYNDYLNSNHIILGMSVAEGFGLPEFQSVALGKHGVILNYAGYKAWANAENACLVESNGPVECYDNIFFGKGGNFNQGNFASWTKEAFHDGVDRALTRYSQDPINKAGLNLQKEFSTEQAFTSILTNLLAN